MESKTYYILDKTGLCINSIVAESPDPQFLKPDERYAPPLEGGGIGYTFTKTGQWLPPTPTESTPPPEITPEQKVQQIRAQRNFLLAASDWTQGKDIPTTISEPWATYRQQLRDITDQPGFPDTVTWPDKPVIS